ncbi:MULTISPECIES: hypothetical protein [Kitasatospora]|uniref:Uncharacterized protein n=1 Tax=Kitasatospora setae (strain ATCC 33774 / DSM 43861 / JCM 3304 / KCC A-0304 / NBRC 14216 / KM-6054) TaxID=452652 RepID=E4N4C5_KITSK|nr:MULTISPECIES: hypothetical protein [Kitasatospora]BAJ26056.1 hypothetical protein KSE_02060 [Kitasatospora setae KM-6054]
MGVWQTVSLVFMPVLAGWSALRILARQGQRLLDYFSALLWSGAAIGLGLGDGPGWLLAAGCVTLAATLLAHLLVVAARRMNQPLREVDPAAFRARLLEVCTTDPSPPAFLAGVGPDGTITVWGLEEAGIPRDRHRPGATCGSCLLEDVVTELAVNGEDVVASYRTMLSRRANQLFVLRRGVISGDWEAELRPVQGLKAPYAHAPCQVHRYGRP